MCFGDSKCERGFMRLLYHTICFRCGVNRMMDLRVHHFEDGLSSSYGCP